ncbi:MAG: single-stranded DNA-binding protein, partial [Candidatus Eremiobacteraeota bacterium]|nr:single-stranded DNA-binding protein [Candidatus Eremiobacteraeota bacterium]
IHKNVAEVIDGLLRGYQPQPEIRQRHPGGEVTVVQEAESESMPRLAEAYDIADRDPDERERPLSIFPYGVSRNKIERAIHNLRVNAAIARTFDEADVVLTLKTLERKQQPKLKQIASDNVPIYSIKTNTTTQIQAALRDVFNLGSIDAEEIALREAEEAVYQVLLTNQAIELSPQTSYVRRMQHQLAERYRLQSRSTGLEPNRRVRIFKGSVAPAE